MKRGFWLAGLILCVAWGLNIAFQARVFESFEPVPPVGPCPRIQGIQGPEDLELLDDTHLLVSSNFHAPKYVDPKLRGALYMLEGSGSAPLTVHRLDTSALPDFRPHGIAAYQRHSAPGTFLVATVNHHQAGDRIELFELTLLSRQLKHLHSLEDPQLLFNANDVVFIEEDSLLVSHDHRARSRVGKLMESVWRGGHAYVSYWNQGRGTKVLEGMNFANGLARLDDQHWVLAAMLDKELHLLSWKAPGKALQVDRSVELPGFPDNVRVDPRTHRIWVAAHGRIFDLKGLSEGRRTVSESKVLSLQSDLGGLRTELASADPSFAGISTAQPFGSWLVLGNIYASFLSYCPLPPAPTQENP